MKNNIFNHGEWICPVEFLNEAPINLLSKEKCAIKPELPEKFKNVHMLTKKTFSIKEKVGSYSIRITADDYYKLYINGAESYKCASVNATDLRGGAACVIAALSANGSSSVSNAEIIDRGYSDIDKRLSSLGADIRRA